MICASLYINTRQIRQSSQQVSALETDLEKTSKDVEKSQMNYEMAKNSFTKEKTVRDELLMQKSGEYIVQLPDLATTETATPSPSPTPRPWEQWQALLSGKN